jgi:hypothetical protein
MSDPTSIQQDIELANTIITPWIATFNPAIGAALGLALKVAAVAEPEVYKAVAAAISGQALTPDQLTELTTIESKLKNAGQYFADVPQPVPGPTPQPPGALNQGATTSPTWTIS